MKSLFSQSGHLVGSVRGCNAPLIQSTIESTLAAEHKVLSGDAERKVVRMRHLKSQLRKQGLQLFFSLQKINSSLYSIG